MTLMGLGTFVIGLLPNYAAWGIAAPIMLICLRLLQGLALGGEYGGAATYVAEHAPQGKRGFYTSWIQTTATRRPVHGAAGHPRHPHLDGRDRIRRPRHWGWRIPFLLSTILLGVSIWIRLKLNKSPVFQRMKEEGTRSKAPLTEAFGPWANAKIAILALLGATAGEAVVWYGGQFYALFFLTQTLKVPAVTAQILIAVALVDRHALLHPVRLALGQDRAQADHARRLPAGGADLLPDLQGDHALRQPRARGGAGLIAGDRHRRSVRMLVPAQADGNRDLHHLVRYRQVGAGGASVNYDNQAAPKGTVAHVKIGEQTIPANTPNFASVLGQAITAHGYPAAADTSKINYPMTVLLLSILVIFVTLVYGPIAAWLVELFPTRIRYTGLSLPYHIGNGWFGGFLPAIVFAIVAATGNIYSGLWYPIVIACMSFVVGFFFLPETKDVDITKY